MNANLGMPLMGIMYPRSEKGNLDNNYEDLKLDEPEEYAALVRHFARVGVDLGADLIKAQFTGSASTFRSVIESCGAVPVIIAGWPLIEKDDVAPTNARPAVEAGGGGSKLRSQYLPSADFAPRSSAAHDRS